MGQFLKVLLAIHKSFSSINKSFEAVENGQEIQKPIQEQLKSKYHQGTGDSKGNFKKIKNDFEKSTEQISKIECRLQMLRSEKNFRVCSL